MPRPISMYLHNNLLYNEYSEDPTLHMFRPCAVLNGGYVKSLSPCSIKFNANLSQVVYSYIYLSLVTVPIPRCHHWNHILISQFYGFDHCWNRQFGVNELSSGLWLNFDSPDILDSKSSNCFLEISIRLFRGYSVYWKRANKYFQ